MGDDDSLVIAEVAHQTGAVGVIAEDGAVISDREGIYGGGMRGPRGEIVGDVDRGDLVWQGDVESPAALPEKLAHPLVKGVRREVIQPIGHRLAGLAAEQAMDERRPAMGDGMSHNSILVRRFCCTLVAVICPCSAGRERLYAGVRSRMLVAARLSGIAAAPAVPVTIHACARQEGTAGSQSATPTR